MSVIGKLPRPTEEPPRVSKEDLFNILSILKVARLNNYGRNKGKSVFFRGRVDWTTRQDETNAFDIYNRYNKPLSPGCEPCHAKVFNWLMDQAFRDMVAQSIDGGGPVSIHVCEDHSNPPVEVQVGQQDNPYSRYVMERLKDMDESFVKAMKALEEIKKKAKSIWSDDHSG